MDIMPDLVVGRYRFTKHHGVTVGKLDGGNLCILATFREEELLEEIEKLREKNCKYEREISLLECQLKLSQDFLEESIKEARRLFNLLDGSKD